MDENQIESAELEIESAEEEVLPEGNENFKKSLETETAKKKHWREKAQKFEEELKALREQKQKTEEKPVEKVPSSDISVRDLLTLRKKGLSDDEIAGAVEKAESLGISVSKLAESGLVDPWVTEMRTKSKAEQATPSSSNRAQSANSKSWEDIALTGTESEKRQAIEKLIVERSTGRNSNQ